MGEEHPAGGLSGRTLGAYRLLEALGTGGMGEVYLAEDTRLGRRVALKLLPPEFSGHPEKIQRFEREARAIASLNHPGIVTLHSIEEAEGRRFLTMEHVEGQTLGSALPRGGLPLGRLMTLAIALTDAVSAAHRQGILHRDLKPENVMLTPEGRLKVLDFGLAKLWVDAPEEDETTRETQSVTQDGRIVGTVSYMSPEQAQGLPVDHRSDVFALGVLTDMLVTNLSQSPTLRVLSTSRLYQILDELGQRDDPAISAEVVGEVARRADVATALVGSFVRAGSQIRIQAQLQDPASGEVLASERVEGDAEEGLFVLVDELTSRIRSRLELKALADGVDPKLEDVTTSSVEAYRYFVQGMHHHERLEEHEARAMLEKAVSADPGFAMAHAKLSVVNANLGDMPRAREFAARALERSERLPPAERHYIEGRYYSLDPKTFNKAVAAYQAAVDTAPDLTSARNNLAQLLLQSRRYREALGHLEELRRRGMSFPGTYMSLAEAYVASGHPERAEQALAEYVEKYPDRAAGFENLGLFLVTRGRYEDALGAYDRAGELDSRNFRADFGHFVVHALEGRWLEAEANARRLTTSAVPKERWEGAAALGVLALYEGDLSTARAVTDEALRLADTPDQRARVRLFRAEIAADRGRADEALAEVKKALAEAPQDARLVAAAHSCQAICLAREGRPEEARISREQVETWLRSLPAPLAEPHRLQLEGEQAWGEGDHARARELLARAAALLPEASIESKAPAARIHFALGRAALEDGRPEEARQAFARVVHGGLERLWEPIAYVRSLALLAGLEADAGRTEEARRLYALYLDHWAAGEIDPDEVGGARKRLAALGGRLPRAA